MIDILTAISIGDTGFYIDSYFKFLVEGIIKI